MSRMVPGESFAGRELVSIHGAAVVVPDPRRLVHLQLRRFAGCPVCSLHLRSFVRRAGDLTAAGVSEVVVFHSPTEDLLDHAAELPFAVIADPDRRLYAELGAETGVRALLSPRAWWPILRAVGVALWGRLRGRQRLPSLIPHGGRYGLPADLLVRSDGRVLAAKYGEHADDQWSVDQVLALARAEGVSGTCAPATPGPGARLVFPGP